MIADLHTREPQDLMRERRRYIRLQRTRPHANLKMFIQIIDEELQRRREIIEHMK